MLDFTEWASVYRTWLARQANPDFLALIAESRSCAPGQGISTEEMRARLAEPGR